MLLTLFIVSAALTLWALAYYKANASTWFGSLALALIGLGLVADLHWSITGLLWGLSGGLFVLLQNDRLRLRYVSGPLFRQFRRVMPPMSQTEQEALEAGSVWWDAELFSGRPDWQRLLATPPPQLTAEEQAFVDGPVQQLCDMLDDWQITEHDRDLPPQVWQFIRRHRLFGMIIPREYGGLGFSALAHSTVVMKLSSRSITSAVTVMVPNSLGPAKLLLHYGSEAQKEYYLPRLATGEEIPCFALTGPDAGSDAGALPDRGIVCYGEYHGETVLGVRLNWEKRYITLGPVATLIGLAFKLYDPEHLLGDDPAPGVTVALVPRDTPGVEIGQRHAPLNTPFQNGPNRGHDVFVPISQIIGGAEGVGKGWRMLVESLAEGRGISLPALSTGAGKTASRYTGAYARIRRQFNLPIGRFEGVQEALARIAGYTYQMDAARTLTLEALDCGEKPSVISAIIKYHLTERYRQVINDAMDVQGGSGICLGPNNLIGRAYQAIPIAITVEGANILTRSMIIFGQGAIRCHPWVLEEFMAACDEDREAALKRFDRAMFGHLQYLLANLAATLRHGLTRGRASSAPGGDFTRRYYQQLNWMSAAFALSADVAMMTLGGALKRKERLSARLGDVLSELYLSSAVLKRFEDQGRPEADQPLVRWSMEQSLYQMQEALRALFRNLPYRPLGLLMKWIVFPTGTPWVEPSDRSGQQAAMLILSDSPARDRLTDGIYVSRDPAQRQGQIELALEQAEKVAPIEEVLRAARRAGAITARSWPRIIEQALAQELIGPDDVAELERMNKLRAAVIKVDAFDDWGKQHLLHQPAKTEMKRQAKNKPRKRKSNKASKKSNTLLDDSKGVA